MVAFVVTEPALVLLDLQVNETTIIDNYQRFSDVFVY